MYDQKRGHHGDGIIHFIAKKEHGYIFMGIETMHNKS